MPTFKGLTAKEMEYEAKVIYEALASGDAPGYTSRQWSILLTQAQEKLLRELISEGWDKDETNRRISSKLVTSVDIVKFKKGKFPNSFEVEFPDDYFHIVQDTANDNVQVLSKDWNYYHANKKNPFEKPDKETYWKLVHEKGAVVITEGSTLSKYWLVYLKRPKPIITANLSTAIEGETEVTNCELDPIVHRKIVERAAKLADYYTNNQVGYQLGALEEQNTK